MEDKVKTLREMSKLCVELQSRDKKVVFAHGCFDIFHKGHVLLFKECKRHADILVVGIDSDKNVRMFKGSNRPINRLDARMFVVSSISFVDYVIEINDFKNIHTANNEILEIYKQLMPNFIVSNTKSDRFWLDKKRRALELGIEIIDTTSYFYVESSTSIARKISKEL